jgi:hypothetical protein
MYLDSPAKPTGEKRMAFQAPDWSAFQLVELFIYILVVEIGITHANINTHAFYTPHAFYPSSVTLAGEILNV